MQTFATSKERMPALAKVTSVFHVYHFRSSIVACKEQCRLFIPFLRLGAKPECYSLMASQVCLPLFAHPISLRLSEQFLNSFSFIFIWPLDTLNRTPIVCPADTLHAILEMAGQQFVEFACPLCTAISASCSSRDSHH